MPAVIDRQAAAEELLKRSLLKSSLVEWAKFYAGEKNFLLAAHHIYMLEKLQQATDGTLLHSKTGKPVKHLIISMPPGSAKSFYSSVVFPVWFMQRREECRILACSHSADLIESFSRECRNAVQAHYKLLGYGLKSDSRAVQEWATTKGGVYKCAGVGAGIAGRRGDLGVIDDFVGSQEDADSKLQRDKVWNWYLKDFWPRLKPNALQVVIATRWHEEDLIGRLIDEKNTYNSPVNFHDWEIISFPFFAEQGDCLGRPKADFTSVGPVDFLTTPDDELLTKPEVKRLLDSRIWPEWFTENTALGVMRVPPRQRAGLYQQRPAPEDGNFYKKDWLLGYTLEEYHQLLTLEPRIYGAGDWAVSESKDANCTCIGGCAMGPDGKIYILPDIFWEVAGPEKVTQAYLDFLKRRNPLVFWSEKGHISQAWGPFFQKMMSEAGVHNYIEEVTVSRDKQVRAQSFRGFCSMYQVRFPTFAAWWPDAQHQMLTFPGGKEDDFIDFLSHIGRGVSSMVRASRPEAKQEEVKWIYTPRYLREQRQAAMRIGRPKYADR